jgi:RHS repeat-associated protein
MSRLKTLLPLLALLLAALPALADVHPNTAPGFPADQSFNAGDVDTVNLFNGALTLKVPIGITYPVNGNFSYSLKLTYNSSPWLFKTVSYLLPPDYTQEVSRTQAYPNPCSNAGLGWRVSLGRMDPPCQVPDANGGLSNEPIYQDENGTDHVFYPVLHYGDAEDAGLSGVSDVQYTRDGSYLRLKVYTAGYREIEFPDGSVRRFGADGLPTEIRDTFGNKLSISYATANQWVLTDTQGRTHRIWFRTDLPSYAQTIDHIDLAASGGATATYQFNYSSQTIGRACPNNDSDQPGSLGSTVTVPLLTSVSLPDGSAWTASASDYVTALPPGSTWPDNSCTENAGDILGWGLPTLGRLEWTWQKVYFPTGSSNRKHLQTNPGVASRTMRNADGTVQGTWTYVNAPGFPDALTSREHSTTVTDQLNHKSVNYFSTALDLSYTGWSTYEYGLPFTRNQTLDAGGTTLNLSRQVYDGATLVRSEYVLFERDPVFATGPPDIYNTNRRVLRTRTVYNDDGATFGGAINSDFNGLGHYRTQTTEGSFAAANVHSQFANHNPASGTYVVNAAGNSGSGFSPFPSGSAWVLDAPTSTSETEGGATAQVDLCYQPGTAAVTRRRTHRLDGAATSAQDLVTVFALSAQGNVTSESYYGGDAQGGIPTGAVDPCSMSLPASPEFQINYTYASGVRATSQYSGTGFYVLNQTIDPSTGLPSSSTDSAGLQTSYEHDALGRLTWSKPPVGQGGWMEYAYSHAAGSTKANVVVRRRANGSKTATVLAVDQTVFDSFGRVYQEFKTMPDGTSAKRQTSYDAAGNKSTVSEWTVGTPGNFTQYLNYDPFGRPGTIRPADGSTHDTTLTYHGVRQLDRKVKVATAQGSEAFATTTEVYDRQGHLLSVTEPSGNGGANVTTTYSYDVGGRLVAVSTPATVGGTLVTQTRSYAYDRAGLRQSETHPEKGASGNGTVTYPKYDSRGHVLRQVDGPHDLTFVFDSAERLYQVQETGGRLLKSFSYTGSNGTNDWSKGKLRTATRYNYETVGGGPITVQVDETYTYGGVDGRASKRDTLVTPTVNGAVQPYHSFTQGFTYNDLGLVSSLSYPQCTHAACTSPQPAVFTDVPVGSPNQKEIEAIYPGITGGCNTSPLMYCPNDAVTRGQMAVFLLKGKEGQSYNPPACTTQIFADVPCSSPFAPWINEFYRRGITGGCSTSPLMYCPDNPVTNAQMAVFLIQTMGVSSGSCTTAPFTDVPCTSFAAAFIAEEARRQLTPGCGGGNFCPSSSITRGAMAALIVRAFDIPVATDPNTSRTVSFSYMQGLLTGVTSGATTYGTLSYYPNRMVSQIAHGNGVTETQANDPNEIRRPAAFSATGPYASWSSGAYGYDGSGNIKTIGASWYTYDPVSRLVGANFYDGATGSGNLKQQSYAFDPFGNLTNVTGSPGRSIPANAQTNRLTGATSYDAAGNLTGWNGAVYNYDAFNEMTHMTSGSEEWVYLYTADDERIWSYNIPANSSRWALRDLDGKTLREYLSNNGPWSVGTDYVYRDGLLLAAETQTGQRHFHLDHLGTPRLITRSSGYPAAYHVYYPFGEEATAFNLDTERMKFAGHERDLASLAGAGDDLDYVHARHQSPLTGRFLSPDWMDGASNRPQSWNKYAYTLDNPMNYVDPDGKTAIPFTLGLGGDAVAGGGAIAAAPPAALIGASFTGGVVLGLEIGQVDVGGATINEHISDGLASLFLIFSKQTGRQMPTNLEGKTVEELKEMLKTAVGKAKLDIIRALKAKGERNKSKGRGGKREPQKPGKSEMSASDDKDRDQSPEEESNLQMFTDSDLELLGIVADLFNLDAERASVCGVGVASCPF